MENPIKLIRNEAKVANPEDVAQIADIEQLNHLYQLKAFEEVYNIVRSDFKSIDKFADLLEVVISWAEKNGFPFSNLKDAYSDRLDKSGYLDGTVLTKLDENNVVNKIYFNQD